MSTLPSWLIKHTPKSSNKKLVRELIDDDSINTVCESAMCPNIGECYSKKTVTFMILGSNCTRNCAFCAVGKGKMDPPDKDEPRKIAKAAKKLGLNYVVVTSVTRDDLADGGAGHFASVVRELKKEIPGIKVELLIPDLQGNTVSLAAIIASSPDVINHNLETVTSLYKKVRPQADYGRSLGVLGEIKKQNPSLYTKSGIMVGLGETKEEVSRLMDDLLSTGCDIMTIGQYIRPSRAQTEPVEYIDPSTFEEYEKIGVSKGFKKVFSGPFVRSSYRAGEIYV